MKVIPGPRRALPLAIWIGARRLKPPTAAFAVKCIVPEDITPTGFWMLAQFFSEESLTFFPLVVFSTHIIFFSLMV
jgi:hypothetical protein